MSHQIARWFYLLLVVSIMGSSYQGADAADGDRAANPTVLKLIDHMPTGGGYVWESTGVPHTILHDGQVILKKTTAAGTYCSGVTFTVAMEAAKRAGLIKSFAFDDIKQFQRDWYGTTDVSAETQCVFAMQRLGIRHAVEHDDAQPGDFVQFWRGKSGHSVVFLAWVTDRQGQRIGLKYWSSQTATDGIGVHTEYFQGASDFDGHVDPDRVYLGRMANIED